MSFFLGSIRAALGIDESDFVRGLINSEAAAEIFGDNVVRFINNPLLGTVGILKDAVGGFSSLVAETARTNAEFARWAERTGASTELLSGLAAEASRLEIELEDVGDALKEIAVKARDALGSEDLAGTFERLGVAVVDTSGNLRNAENIFLDVADGLRNLSNATERAAIADELLSDAGTRLLPILARGSEGIREIVAEARLFGLVVDGEAARASIRFEGQLQDLRLALEGIKRSNATAFIEGFAGSLDDSDQSIASMTASLNQSLNPAMERLGEIMAEIANSDWLRDTIDGLVVAADLVDDLTSKFETLNNAIPFDLGDFASGFVLPGPGILTVKALINAITREQEGIREAEAENEQREQIIQERRRANQRMQRSLQS